MKKPVISVIGLGYVGLPLAAAFAEYFHVIGFDIRQARIDQLQQGVDVTGEVAQSELRRGSLHFTSDEKVLGSANFYIVAVPTPVTQSKQPDLSPLEKASACVGRHLKKGDYVVFESTVFPGATEEVCLPILERLSQLVAGKDFFIGYSPERINPGDKVHTFKQIIKVVSGQSTEATEYIASVYAKPVSAGVFKAASIRVAEAAKVIENTQRDINIAFMNELMMIFSKMNIDIYEVLEAAKTKWNFLSFSPGLVGGHCIGVDPYYLAYKAKQLGYNPEMILSGRRINDGMGKYVAEQLIKQMMQKNLLSPGVKVGILGFTFKENCPDVRNTRVIDIIDELKQYSIDSMAYDPYADPKEVKAYYKLELATKSSVLACDAVIIAVCHDCFLEKSMFDILSQKPVVIDLKNLLSTTLT